MPSAVEKMVVLQSHLVDLFPPEKEEEDPDDAGVSKQLMLKIMGGNSYHEGPCSEYWGRTITKGGHALNIRGNS